MQVFCSNCNTAHDVTYAQANNSDTSVINCRKCDKKIKFQFCPHCGAFYSITFSNIKHGRYKYSCKRCMKDFAIEFKPKEIYTPAPPPGKKPVLEKPVHVITEPDEEVIVSKTEQPVLFMNNSINTFSAGELFRSASEAFTVKKILVSAVGVITMLLIIQLFNSIESLLVKRGTAAVTPFAGSLINLFPMAIIFSFYTLFASVISKITLDRIFHSEDTGTEKIIKFTLKTGPGVFAGHIIILLSISSMLHFYRFIS
jgi:transcription elongation factor Elf1